MPVRSCHDDKVPLGSHTSAGLVVLFLFFLLLLLLVKCWNGVIEMSSLTHLGHQLDKIFKVKTEIISRKKMSC